ncbi:hypothetical protein HDU97_009321 [Phlyctochytrium planicorne]|nr:hypothetical protein HDU97_009321 [Phlyctochytrium planicorne]
MELYLPPFEACIREGVGAIMCAYNKFNNVYSCENSALINYILKGSDINFRGFVMTDWWAAHSEVPTAMVSDMMMPGTRNFLSKESFFGKALVRNVESGRVPESRVDDMVTRILAAHLKMGQDADFPPTTIDSWAKRREAHPDDDENGILSPMQKQHANHSRAVAAASTILLLNRNGILPLSGNLTKIAILGEDAGPPSKLNKFEDRAGSEGTLAQGWGSGTSEFPYLVTPLRAIKKRLSGKGVSVVYNLNNKERRNAAKLAAESDLAIVFVNSNSGEAYKTVEFNGGDRNYLNLWHGGDALIDAVAASKKPIVVVVHSVGQVDMPWLRHQNVMAVIYALLPGQESGNAIADILFGDVNPSGRLPFTIHKRRRDYAADVIYSSWRIIPQIDYTEGIFIDYMHADEKGVETVFPFGHGLSYSSFKYSDVRLNASTITASSMLPIKSKGDEIGPQQPPKAVGITVTVTNQDKQRSGHEVVQLYLEFPLAAKKPPRLLKGFERVWINAGGTAEVHFTLGYFELRSWGIVAARGWDIVRGPYRVRVGASSLDLEVAGRFEVV